MGIVMKTLAQLEPLLLKMGATAKNGATWIERLDHLRNSMIPTLPGQSRPFPNIKAKQLIFVAALVKAGARPAQADAYAAAAMSDIEVGQPVPEWLVVAAGDFQSGLPTDFPDVAELTEHFGAVPLTMIPLRAIEKMVDDLYEGA
jgi:hypothetical protein